MIEGYIDESGTHAGASALSVAVTVASAEGWLSWSQAWSPYLATVGVYHAKKHGRLHEILADLIVEHTLFSSYVTIREETYSEKFPAWVKGILGGAYSRLVLMTLMSASLWARDNNVEPIYYHIEQGHRHFPQLANMMNALMRSPDAREMFWVAGWRAATKSDLPIACPDTLAHLATTSYDSGRAAPILQKIRASGRLWTGDFSDELIDESLPQYIEVARLTKADIARSRELRRRYRRDRKG